MIQRMAAMRTRTDPRHAILLWLSLAALLLQSFVLQTHLHLPSGSPASPRVDRVASAGISSGRPISGGHSGCPLCAEMKIAGHYLAPTPFVLIAPAIVVFWFRRMIAASPARAQPTHHWRSRAPPLRAH